MKTLLVIVLTLALALAASAIPTLTGPSGGFTEQQATVVSGVNIAIDQSTPANPGIYGAPNTRVLVGLTDSLEIGGAFQKTINKDEAWNVNAKYLLPDMGGMKLGISALYGAPTNAEHQWDVKLIASKMLNEQIMLSANLGYLQMVTADEGTPYCSLSAERAVGPQVVMGSELVIGNKLTGHFTMADALQQTTSLVPPIPVYNANRAHINLYTTFGLAEGTMARAGVIGIGQGTMLFLGLSTQLTR